MAQHDLLRASREAGVPVTFASDAHAPNEVAADFGAALDVLEPVDDLVVREEAAVDAGLNELLEFLDLRKCDIDGEHLTSAFSRNWRVVG